MWVYNILGCLLRLDYNGFVNLFRMDFDFTVHDTSPVKKANKEDIRAVVDWFSLHFIIMTSLMTNYVYRIAFADFVS